MAKGSSKCGNAGKWPGIVNSDTPRQPGKGNSGPKATKIAAPYKGGKNDTRPKSRGR